MVAMFLTSEASVLEFSIKDIFVELQTWGTVTMGRYNVNATDFFDRHIEGSFVTFDIKEIRTLDSSHSIINRYNLRDMKSRLFTITRWQGSEYGLLGASGRSMTAVNSGGLPGSIQIKAYIFTEDGTVHHETFKYQVKVGDVLFDVELTNTTKCSSCEDIYFIEMVVGIKGSNGLPENVHLVDDSNTNIEVPGSAVFHLTNLVSKVYYTFLPYIIIICRF